VRLSGLSRLWMGREPLVLGGDVQEDQAVSVDTCSTCRDWKRRNDTTGRCQSQTSEYRQLWCWAGEKCCPEYVQNPRLATQGELGAIAGPGWCPSTLRLATARAKPQGRDFEDRDAGMPAPVPRVPSGCPGCIRGYWLRSPGQWNVENSIKDDIK